MSRYGIIFNVDRCIGCEACFVACKEENKVAPGIQWNKIRRIENVGKRVINYYRVSCQHCEDPACMKVCPAKAISKGPHGEVLVDHKKCIGCRMCLAACPYGAPLFNEDGRTGYFGDKEPLLKPEPKAHQVRVPGKAEHCTLCTHRLAEGRLPACVENCSTKALTLVDYDSKDPEVQALIKRSICLSEEAGTQPKVRYICSNMAFKSVKLK